MAGVYVGETMYAVRVAFHQDAGLIVASADVIRRRVLVVVGGLYRAHRIGDEVHVELLSNRHKFRKVFQTA
jgi:hypothetical protein